MFDFKFLFYVVFRGRGFFGRGLFGFMGRYFKEFVYILEIYLFLKINFKLVCNGRGICIIFLEGE